MAIFPTFFEGNRGQENVFYDILDRKIAYLGCKKKNFKSRKIDNFPRGLTHGFGPKMAFFPAYFLANIGQENVFYDILERKHAFLGKKKKSLKRRKIHIFPKGLTHGFGPKMAIFVKFFFRQ